MSRRLKSLAGLVVDQADRGELPYLALEHLEGGTGALVPQVELPFRRGGDPGTSAVKQGDVLFGKLRPYLAKTLLVREPAYASTELMALRPYPAVEARYLAYLVGSRPLIEWATASSDGTKMPRTSWEKLGEFRVDRLPTTTVQRAIADYLDTETARIDALIAKKQRMIGLLEQRRSAALWAVLTTDCPEPMRVKDLVSKVGSGSTPRGGADVYVESGVAFLHSQNVRDGRVQLDDVVFITEEEDVAMSGTRVRKGDVLLNITGGSIGRTAVVHETDLPANVSQHVCIIRPAAGVVPGVLQAGLDTDSVRQQISLMQVGGNREGLNFEQVRNLEVHVPTVGSALVADRIDAVNSTHRRPLELLRHQIDLLREHRQALITSAVTGELEIPGVAA